MPRGIGSRYIEVFIDAETWVLDTGWACGAVFVLEGRIVGGAPVFRSFVGQSITRVASIYRANRIDA